MRAGGGLPPIPFTDLHGIVGGQEGPNHRDQEDDKQERECHCGYPVPTYSVQPRSGETSQPTLRRHRVSPHWIDPSNHTVLP